MLLNLHVKNLALIKEADIDFMDGLNILTGETGAGKSIVIGSINIALGEKASKEFIREDVNSALVELVFSDTGERARQSLIENGIEVQEDDSIIITRKIAKNSSTCKVNGETVTLSTLRKITSLLVDVHGQHEHQSLLNISKHMEILDDFAEENIGDIKKQLKDEYKKNKEVKEKLNSLNVNEEERIREISFYEFELQEIDAAELKEAEDTELENLYKKLSNAEKISENMHAVFNAVSYENEGAGDKISSAIGELNKITELDDGLSTITSMLNDIDSICKDLSHEVYDYINNNKFDEEEYFNTGKRLDVINHLKSKYGNTISKILEYREEKEKVLNELKNYELIKEEYIQKLKESNLRLEAAAAKLSKIRKKAAKELETKILVMLKDLNFLDVSFEISITKNDIINLNGYDTVEFLISTNPGEKVKSLGKVASGGELSRIMLAIKTVLAEKDDVGTLIFDEIDSGISGKTAWMVAEKLNIISNNRQVLCISHLPQIASMADNHFLIEKNVLDGKTVTDIKVLNDNDSVNELARLLGGNEVGDAVLNNAREIKQQALKQKNEKNS